MHARLFCSWRPGEYDAALRPNTVLIGVCVTEQSQGEGGQGGCVQGVRRVVPQVPVNVNKVVKQASV